MKKKILFVINTMGLAGAEVAMLELMRRMESEDAEIFLYILTGQGELIDKVPSHVHILNRKCCKASVLSSKGRRTLAGTCVKALFRRGNLIRFFPYLVSNTVSMAKAKRLQADKLLWRILAEGGERFPETFDLAVAFLEGGATYYAAKHVKASKKAAFVHVDYQQAGYTRKLDRDAYETFDKVYAVSEETKMHFLACHPECAVYTEVFENLMNREEILEKSRQASGFSDSYNGLRILTVGRLTKQKAYDIAIKAMAEVKNRGINARWYVLGEGTERKALEKLIKIKGLEQDFLLMGAVDNPYPFFAEADLYVHATRFEGKSIAVREAQMLGCCIVASDCNGNRDQIEDGKDGALCSLTPLDVAECIESLAGDELLRKKYREAAGKKGETDNGEWKKIYGLLE